LQEYEKSIVSLTAVGAFIGLGKLLISSEKITFRVVVGRAILGSATSLLAGIVLYQVPNLHPMAILGLGSGRGIIGQQYLELLLRERFSGLLVRKAKGK
jgi:hypothetical protein